MFNKCRYVERTTMFKDSGSAKSHAYNTRVCDSANKSLNALASPDMLGRIYAYVQGVSPGPGPGPRVPVRGPGPPAPVPRAQ